MDSDLPKRSTWPQRQHLRLGRALIRLKRVFSAPVSIAAKCVILDQTGGVLLIRHTYVPGFHLPGGGVDQGETVADAMRREIAEELGFAPEQGPELVQIYLNTNVGGTDHIALFRAQVSDSAKLRPRLPEVAEAEFFSPDALPLCVTVATKNRIAEVLGQKTIAEIW